MTTDVYALVQSVQCPRCNAKAGEPCVMDGVTMEASPHLARWDAARKAGVKVRENRQPEMKS